MRETRKARENSVATSEATRQDRENLIATRGNEVGSREKVIRNKRKRDRLEKTKWQQEAATESQKGGSGNGRETKK